MVSTSAPRAGLGAAGGRAREPVAGGPGGDAERPRRPQPRVPVALTPCPRGPAALPSAGTAHSAPGAHAVPALAPSPREPGRGHAGVCVCVWGEHGGCVTSRGCPLRHPARDGHRGRTLQPPGLAPGPDPSWAGPGRGPGGHCSAAPFFCFSCWVKLCSASGASGGPFRAAAITERTVPLLRGVGGRRWPVGPGAVHRTTRQPAGPALEGAGHWGLQPSASPEPGKRG